MFPAFVRTMARCVYCGEEVEEGYFGAVTNSPVSILFPVSSPSWYHEASWTGMGGEPLGPVVTGSGMAYFPGGRCKKCRVMFLSY